MKKYTDEEIKAGLEAIDKMDHYQMARMWRFNPIHTESIYFRGDLPTGVAFKERLFTHFGGFTTEISKELGWG